MSLLLSLEPFQKFNVGGVGQKMCFGLILGLWRQDQAEQIKTDIFGWKTISGPNKFWNKKNVRKKFRVKDNISWLINKIKEVGNKE